MQLAHHGAEQIRKVEKPIERKSVTETLAGNLPRVNGQIRAKKESIEGVQPEEEYYEELLKEREELQTRLLQYAEPPGNEDIRERGYHVNEEKGINEGTDKTSEMGPPAFPPLPPLPPILPPPFTEMLSEKIKKLSERELFR